MQGKLLGVQGHLTLKRSTVYYKCMWPIHRYVRKVDYSSFVMPLLLVFALPRVFLWQPQIVTTRQTWQAIRAINQSIFIMSMGQSYHSNVVQMYHATSSFAKWNSAKQLRYNIQHHTKYNNDLDWLLIFTSMTTSLLHSQLKYSCFLSFFLN